MNVVKNKLEVTIGIIVVLYGAVSLFADNAGLSYYIDWLSLIFGGGFVYIGLAG